MEAVAGLAECQDACWGGYELVHAIRNEARLSHLPVYLVIADVKVRGHAESDGFTGILLKPITLKGLQQLLA